MPHLPLISAADAGEIRQDILELFDELAAALPTAERGGSGECHPSIDVVESAGAIEVFVDLAGVAPRAVRIIYRADLLLIVGEKPSGRPPGPGNFHLVEREFGRFARAVRLSGAFDVSAARARLADGELHVFLPKLEERRGQAHRIQVLAPPTQGDL